MQVMFCCASEWNKIRAQARLRKNRPSRLSCCNLQRRLNLSVESQVQPNVWLDLRLPKETTNLSTGCCCCCNNASLVTRLLAAGLLVAFPSLHCNSDMQAEFNMNKNTDNNDNSNCHRVFVSDSLALAGNLHASDSVWLHA